MAKKNIYSELINRANKADFLNISNKGGIVTITNSHWIFETSAEQYALCIAEGIKGFPVVRDGECYIRNGKDNAKQGEPLDTAKFFESAELGEPVTVTKFSYHIPDKLTRVLRFENGEYTIVNEDYYKIIESLIGIEPIVRAVNSISPILFKIRENERMIICPISNTIKTDIEDTFYQTATLSAKNPTKKAEVAEAKAEEPVKAEKKAEPKKAKAKAEKKPTTKKAETKKAEKKQSKKAEPKKAEPVKAEPTNEEVAKAYWRKNEEHKGIEVVFPSSPKAEIRTALKSNGFRWHNTKKMWFAKETKERLALVKSLVG